MLITFISVDIFHTFTLNSALEELSKNGGGRNVVLMMATTDDMDPAEDIIDVLYRSCRENKNH